MVVIWIVATLALANLLSAIFLRRVWNRNRFVTPAEPIKFNLNVAGSVLIILATAYMIHFADRKQVELHIPPSAEQTTGEAR